MKLFSRSVVVALLFLFFVIFLSLYIKLNRNGVVGAVVALFS